MNKITRMFFGSTLLITITLSSLAKEKKPTKYHLSLGLYNTHAKIIANNIKRPPKPIFWTAKLNVDYAAFLALERTFFTHKNYLEIRAGSSIGSLGASRDTNDHSYVFSLYLMTKFYLFSTKNFQLFILYSPGGPSYLSNTSFATTKFSNNFVFQNQLGLGLTIKDKLGFFLKIYHFSNGDLFPINGGIDTPLLMGISIGI